MASWSLRNSSRILCWPDRASIKSSRSVLGSGCRSADVVDRASPTSSNGFARPSCDCGDRRCSFLGEKKALGARLVLRKLKASSNSRTARSARCASTGATANFGSLMTPYFDLAAMNFLLFRTYWGKPSGLRSKLCASVENSWRRLLAGSNVTARCASRS